MYLLAGWCGAGPCDRARGLTNGVGVCRVKLTPLLEKNLPTETYPIYFP
jgi:hypothetical protein